MATFARVSTFWLLLVLLSSGLSFHSVKSEHVPKLYWSPNNAGLFSQYLQLKLLIHHSAPLGRVLVVVPTTSPHYQNKEIKICEIFVVPSNVSCSSLPSKVRCTKNFEQLVGEPLLDDVCYSGTVAFSSGARVRSLIIKSVDIPLQVPFQFTAAYEAVSILLFNNLLRTSCTNVVHCKTLGKPFTVVHWRRGDQLQGRCLKSVDTSVNCQNATALVQRVREFSSDPIVYVATNEPQNSREMAELRRLGFVTYQDAARDNTHLWNADDFAVLAAETHLMLAATTFLAWGVSEINDVVEHERREAGLSHCIGQDRPAVELQHNWCTVHKLSNSVAK